MRQIAKEGRCFVLSAWQFMQRSDCPIDYPVAGAPTTRRCCCAGGSCIIASSGEPSAGPAYDGRAILVADVDLNDIVRGGYDLDVAATTSTSTFSPCKSTSVPGRRPVCAPFSMRTIYLRKVPDDAVDRLERLAARAGMSLSAFTVRELSEVSQGEQRGDPRALAERRRRLLRHHRDARRLTLDVVVVDAAVAVGGLLRTGPARERLSTEALHAPLTRSTQRSSMRSASWCCDAASRPSQPVRHSSDVIGTRRSEWSTASDGCDTTSAFDAAYIALAEALGCNLVTADQRLAAAGALRCTIEMVRL